MKRAVTTMSKKPAPGYPSGARIPSPRPAVSARARTSETRLRIHFLCGWMNRSRAGSISSRNCCSAMPQAITGPRTRIRSSMVSSLVGIVAGPGGLSSRLSVTRQMAGRRRGASMIEREASRRAISASRELGARGKLGRKPRHGRPVVQSSVRSTPWFLWPFVMLWRVVTWILGLTGRLLAVILGLVLMIIGVVISLTVVGAILGVPLAILGFLLVLRGLF